MGRYLGQHGYGRNSIKVGAEPARIGTGVGGVRGATNAARHDGCGVPTVR